MRILFLRALLREVSRNGSWCLDLFTDFTVFPVKISISDFFYHLTFTSSTFLGGAGVSFIILVFSLVWLEIMHWDFNVYPRFAISISFNCFAICIFTLLQPQSASMPISALGI